MSEKKNSQLPKKEKTAGLPKEEIGMFSGFLVDQLGLKEKGCGRTLCGLHGKFVREKETAHKTHLRDRLYLFDKWYLTTTQVEVRLNKLQPLWPYNETHVLIKLYDF